jgi:hypothetical protein
LQFETLANNPAQQKAAKCAKCPQHVTQHAGGGISEIRGEGVSLNKKDQKIYK